MSVEHKYQANYCEENIWHLLQEAEFQTSECFAVVISNTGKCFAMWEQKSGSGDQPVMWDYHVVMVSRGEELAIWDLDSRLGAPMAAQEWVQKSFHGCATMPESFHPTFRIVDGNEFVDTFSSDRSHMLVGDNAYREPVPPWPAIGAGAPSNLHRFINMGFEFTGLVYDLDDFTIWLG